MSPARVDNLDLMAPPVVKTIGQRSLIVGLIFGVISVIGAFVRTGRVLPRLPAQLYGVAGGVSGIDGDSNASPSHQGRLGHDHPADSGSGDADASAAGAAVHSNLFRTAQALHLGAAPGFDSRPASSGALAADYPDLSFSEWIRDSGRDLLRHLGRTGILPDQMVGGAGSARPRATIALVSRRSVGRGSSSMDSPLHSRPSTG